MEHQYIPHIPIYEGYKDPKLHWFICETIWDAADVNNKAKQIACFVGA